MKGHYPSHFLKGWNLILPYCYDISIHVAVKILPNCFEDSGYIAVKNPTIFLCNFGRQDKIPTKFQKPRENDSFMKLHANFFF